MTKTEQDIFFALLRSAIWEKPMEMEYLEGKEYSWIAILQAFADHALLGVVTNAVMRLPEEYRPDEELQQEILQFCEDLKEMHKILNHAVAESFSILKSEGIHPVLLKGQGLSTLYPSSCVRSCGDIDIYVGEDDFEKACVAINDFCGVTATRDELFEDGLHYHVAWGKVIFEIHRKAAYTYGKSKQSAFDSFTNEFMTKELLDNVLINNKSIPVPPIRYNIIYLFMHLSKHIIKAEDCLRQLIDLVFVISNSNLDYNLFMKDLKFFGLVDSWRKIECFLVETLGMPIKEKVDAEQKIEQNDELSRLFLSTKIFNSCNETKKYKQLPYGFSRLCHSLKDYYNSRKLSFVLFPCAASMEMYRHYKIVVLNRLKKITYIDHICL